MADYELVVLGAGATGLAAARTAAKDGHRTAIVEADRPGGDCTHYGCVPSKALLETARRVQAARSGPQYGFRADVTVDFPAVMDRVHRVIDEIEQDESPELLARQGIDLLKGWGVVTGPDSMEVDGRRITFDRLVVASGSKALVPPIDGLTDVAYLDNKTVFSLRELPEHLLVLGGGPIGVELAQAFRRLGAQVTVVEGAPTILGREEPEAQKALTTVLQREGVTLRTGATVTRVSTGPVLHLSDGTSVSGTHVLVAVGRRASTEGIGLESAGVRLEKGLVVTDDKLRAAKTVWAAGDCTSRLQFTHVGDEQGRLAAKNALSSSPFGGKAWDDEVVPWVTFTEPEVAHVGLTEAQAVAQQRRQCARVERLRKPRGNRARTAGEQPASSKLVGCRQGRREWPLAAWSA
jgi:pyruvate/2-oxoglutarate dehydrogenase complex dihydrolipoamide dehydrogenase (E3) component